MFINLIYNIFFQSQLSIEADMTRLGKHQKSNPICNIIHGLDIAEEPLNKSDLFLQLENICKICQQLYQEKSNRQIEKQKDIQQHKKKNKEFKKLQRIVKELQDNLQQQRIQFNNKLIRKTRAYQDLERKNELLIGKINIIQNQQNKNINISSKYQQTERKIQKTDSYCQEKGIGDDYILKELEFIKQQNSILMDELTKIRQMYDDLSKQCQSQKIMIAAYENYETETHADLKISQNQDRGQNNISSQKQNKSRKKKKHHHHHHHHHHYQHKSSIKEQQKVNNMINQQDCQTPTEGDNNTRSPEKRSNSSSLKQKFSLILLFLIILMPVLLLK